MSLKINDAIYYLLSNNQAIVNIVGAELFPIVAAEDTQAPFIIYKRESLDPEYTKDGHSKDDVIVSVSAITADYDEGIDLIEKVRTAIELKSGVIAEINIKSIRVTGAQEIFGVNEYLQKLTFEIKTTKTN
jgi:hypothetical protein